MVTLLRGVTEFETYILTNHHFIQNFAELYQQGDTVQYRVYRVHDGPGGT